MLRSGIFGFQNDEPINEMYGIYLRFSGQKTRELDSFPTNLLREFPDILVPVIIKTVNISLESADFSQDLKEALVNLCSRRTH